MGYFLLALEAHYSRELIETLAWAHERTPLANLIRWREKPMALSIVQARLLGLAHFSVGYKLTYAGGNWLLGRAAALGKEGKVFHSIRESWYLSIIVFVAPVAAEPLCCWFDPAGSFTSSLSFCMVLKRKSGCPDIEKFFLQIEAGESLSANLVETSAVKTPQQNGVVERKNHTLFDAARTMLIFSHASLFLWAEAIATAWALGYPKNDREDVSKLGAKGDIGFFIGYSANSVAYRVYNWRTKKIIETMNVTFGLELTYAPLTITPQKPSERDLNILFKPLHNEYFGGQPSEAPRTIPAAPQSQQHAQQQGNHTSLLTASATDNVSNVVFKGDLFVNPFATPSTESAALYGLKQAPRAWYDELSTFLLQNGFSKGIIDPKLFTRRFDDDILVAQGAIELYFVKTDYQLADIFTKALPVDRFNYLVRHLGMRSLCSQELDRLAKLQ
nr:photosystem I P700 chlorophyll a apoprotein A2, chloroplastic [Tanacetum cinerariifolium]